MAGLFCLLGCGGQTETPSGSPPTSAPLAPAAAQDAVVDDAPADDLPSVRMVPVFPDLTFDRPVFLTHPPGDTERLFVVEQIGRIKVMPNRPDASATKVVLDIEGRINNHLTGGNEEGLLGLAFHPDFAKNKQFYVYYTAPDPRRGVISRMRMAADDPDRADPASEEVILEVPQPFGNHNGSTVLFGPDGFLYASFGDGGSANDPHENAQNLGTLLGSIIRIDVNRAENGRPYGIPEDNPFIKRAGARPEIWAYGLRNVWRMSFDREKGDLWAGDVGQNLWEEIHLVSKRDNCGWDIREGFHPFKGGRSPDPLIDPVVEYRHDLGSSVTGGYVYRGTRLKRLVGAYVYGDYVTGRMWALRHNGMGVTASKVILEQPKNIASFSEGPDGELYVLVFDGKEGKTGRIFVLEEV